MNDSRSEHSPDVDKYLSDAWLDRLVDGEVSTSEYRHILEALGRHPENWQRCAQAFLQAQAWQRDLSNCFAPTDEIDSLEDALGRAKELSCEPLAEEWDSRSETDSAPTPVKPSRAFRLDWLAPAVSLAAIGLAFLGGWKLSNRQAELSMPGVAVPPITAASQRQFVPAGHVRLAVDEGQSSFAVPYFQPSQYPEMVSTSAVQGEAIEDWLEKLPADRLRTVMPGKIDEQHDVLLPLEVISIPSKTDFQ